MKSLQLPFLALCMLASTFLTAQVTNNLQLPTSVNTDGSAPNASAILDVQSTTQGMLVPRMTTAQRTTIATPATGLLVYDTDTGGFWFYNGTAWADLSASKTLADADGDTKIQVEESPNEDIIRMDLGGSERFILRKNIPNSRTVFDLPNNDGNVLIGQSAGDSTTTGVHNIFIGPDAGRFNKTGNGNVYLGKGAGQNGQSPFSNIFIGFEAGMNSTSGDNTFIGSYAGKSSTTGGENTFLGSFTGTNNTTGSQNTFLGRYAGQLHETGGSNTFVGRGAGSGNISGGGNVFLGRSAGENETGSNKLYIDNSNTASPLIYGEFNNDLVGINGKLGVNTSAPDAMLEVENGAVLFEGATGATPVSGSGTRLMWVPAKAALRAGIASGTDWDDANIGARSFVFGTGTASAFGSFVAGDGTASNSNSFVGGGTNNVASGIDAFMAGGSDNVASGKGSFVGGGNDNIAAERYGAVVGGDFNHAMERQAFIGGGIGNTSTAWNTFIGGGQSLLARSINEAVFGTYNTDYTPAGNATDRLFVIGNGTGTSARSNAVTVLKNGDVGIGTPSPDAKLDVNGEIQMSSANIPMGLTTEIGGDEPLFNFDVNFRHDNLNTVYRGAAFRIDTRDNNPLFQWIARAAGSAGGGIIMELKENGNLGVGINPTTNKLQVNGDASKSTAGDWLANSDARLKTNIRPLDSKKILEKMLVLQGVTYEWKDDQTGSQRPKGTMYGFTAQNIQQVFPELVSKDNMGYLQTAYGTYDAMTVEAIRALKNENDELRAEMKTIKSQLSKMDDLKSRMAKLEAALNTGTAQKD